MSSLCSAPRPPRARTAPTATRRARRAGLAALARTRAWRLITAGLLLAVASACGAAESAGPEGAGRVMDRDTFVEVIVELRLAARDANDLEAFNARRDAILERHGLTEDDLLRFAEVRGSDVKAMIALWEAVAEALTTAAEPGPAR